MNYNSVMVYLQTMSEYNTVKIKQIFTAKDGTSLSVRCLPGTYTFEIDHSATQELLENDSIDKTAEYIIEYLASRELSTDS